MPTTSLPSPKRQPARKSWGRRGARYVASDHRLEFLFEVSSVAEDDKGKPAPAGMRLKIGLKPGAAVKAPGHYEALATKFAKNGFPDMKIGPGRLTPLTWAQFSRRGYN